MHVAFLMPAKSAPAGQDRFSADADWVWGKLVFQPPQNTTRTSGNTYMWRSIVPVSSIEWAARPYRNSRFMLCSQQEAASKTSSVASTFMVLASAIQQKAADLDAVLREHLANNALEEQPVEDDVGGLYLRVDDVETESDEEG